jgi:streptogramin lyase
MDKRQFLTSVLGLGLAGIAAPVMAQTAAERDAARIARETRGAPVVPTRMVRTTDLFSSPEGYPNAIHAQPEGLWIGEQRTVEGIGVSNDAYLVDWSGKVLRKVKTESINTSGMAFGDGHLWMGANGGPQGIFETDLDGKTVSHRQIPLGFANGGGCHGVAFHKGKLYIAALRLRGILRVDPKSWTPEVLIPCSAARMHGLAVSDDAIWMVTAASNTDPNAALGLTHYDPKTGAVVETAEFVPGSADPHGLTFRDGILYGCDAGIHPGWPNRQSKSSGKIFRIDFV